ncbi:hypothetical protein ACB092_03G025200 [Castanea dentata]
MQEKGYFETVMLYSRGDESMANTRWEKRQPKVLAKAKKRMRKQKNSDKSESYWSNLWSKPRDSQNSETSRL